MDTCDGSRTPGQQLAFPVMNTSTCDQIVGEWKNYISLVDTSMTSLANALDMMHAAIQNATGNTGYHNLQGENEDKQSDNSFSLHVLLMCIERTVLHDRNFAISTVTNFIHTVISAITRMSGASIEEFEPLSLDTYRKQYKEIDNLQTLQVRTLEMLTRENFHLKEEERLLQSQILVLTEKEKKFLNENDNLRDKTKYLEKSKEELEELNKQSEERISELAKDIEKFRAEHKESSIRKRRMDVQERQEKETLNKYRILQAQHEEILKRQSKEKDSANEQYLEKIENLTSEVDLYSSSFNKAKETVEQLKKEVKEKNSQIDFYKTKLQEKEKNIENRSTEMYQLRAKYKESASKSELEKESIRKENEENAATIKRLKLQIEETRRNNEDNENFQQKYDEIQERHDSIKEALQSKDREVDNLKTIIKQLNSFERQNTELKGQLDRLKGDFKKLSGEKDSLLKDLKNEKTSHHNSLKMNIDLSKTVDDLFAEKQDLLTRLNQTSETNQRLTSENERLVKDISNLNQELQMYKSKKLIQVQLYYQRRGELITTVEEELTRILKRRIESTGKTEIEFVKCVHTSDVNTELPLLLLCISASRIGTDAANTVHGLQLSSKMSLLIFHHKDVHALPSQASYQVLTGGEFKAMNGIFDLAFLSGKGIYSCPLNDNSIDKIVTFINTESVAGSADGLSR